MHISSKLYPNDVFAFDYDLTKCITKYSPSFHSMLRNERIIVIPPNGASDISTRH